VHVQKNAELHAWPMPDAVLRLGPKILINVLQKMVALHQGKRTEAGRCMQIQPKEQQLCANHWAQLCPQPRNRSLLYSPKEESHGWQRVCASRPATIHWWQYAACPKAMQNLVLGTVTWLERTRAFPHGCLHEGRSREAGGEVPQPDSCEA
jgi:hypothetical protein